MFAKVFTRSSHSLKWKDTPDNGIAMGLADMDFKVPRFVVKAVQRYLKQGDLGYYDVPDEFYASVSNWLNAHLHKPIEKSDVIAVSGVIPAIRAIVQRLTLAGAKILIQEPVYHFFKKIILDLRRIVVVNEIVNVNGRYEIDFSKLKQQLKNGVKIFILCSPHNPVGRVWDYEEICRIVELCLENNVILLADEIHSDLCMPGQNFYSTAQFEFSFDTPCVVLNSSTKAFNFAGLRGGYIVVRNRKLKRKISEAVKCLGIDRVSSVFSVATIAAYKYGRSWNKRLTLYLYRNYRFLVEYLSYAAPFLHVTNLQATYLAWIDYSKMNISEDTLVKALSNSVIVEPGTTFGINGRHYLRINIACSSIILENALTRIVRVCVKIHNRSTRVNRHS